VVKVLTHFRPNVLRALRKLLNLIGHNRAKHVKTKKLGGMSRIKNRNTEKMSDASFKGMIVIFQVIDFLFHYIDKRIKKFNIQNGMTVVDYRCGPGRYSIKFAEIVGN